MGIGEAVAWGTVILGLLLSVIGLRATLYFGRENRIVHSWIIQAVYRTCLTITGVSLGLTVARAVQLTIGPLPWVSVISGSLIVWLLIVPFMLQRIFKSHEGVAINHIETVIEREDREVGDERRKRQAKSSE